jgi:hypothetical protein
LFELENLLENKVLDETAVMEQFKRLEKARGNLSTKRFNFMLGEERQLALNDFTASRYSTKNCAGRRYAA